MEIGREYAAAVQEYLRAAMAWLSWIERHDRSYVIAGKLST